MKKELLDIKTRTQNEAVYERKYNNQKYITHLFLFRLFTCNDGEFYYIFLKSFNH